MSDNKVIFNQIAMKAAEGIKEQFPIEGKNRILEISDVEFEPRDITNDDEYDARYNGKTLTAPLYAKTILKDKSGNIINEKRIRILDLPVFTNRNTFIVNGNEYTVAYQNRVKPGIYPIVKQTGEIEANINAAKGLPEKANIGIDPESGQFKFIIGQSSLSLYPILNAVGIPDETLRKEWGEELFIKNKTGVSKKVFESTIMKTAERLTKQKFNNTEEAKLALQKKMNEIILDPTVNKKTIGIESGTLDHQAMIAATRKLLRINRGEEQPVDRNSIEFKNFYWVDDFVKERIRLYARQVKQKIMKKVDKEDDIENIITPSFFSKTVQNFFSNASLSELADQYNPLDILNAKSKVTSTGEGGIQNLQVVDPNTRALLQTTMGLLDPIHTPESEKIGVDLHLSVGARKDGNSLKVHVYNMKTGQIEEVDHETLTSSAVALPGKSFQNGKFTAKEVRAQKNGKIQVVPVEEIQYVIPRPQSLFDNAVNLVPFLNTNSGARVFMAAKQMGQAIPVVTREEPLVQVAVADKSLESIHGKKNSLYSPVDGTVKKIEGNKIFIEDKNGKKHIISYKKDFPLNHDHIYDTDLYIKPGDKVSSGQLIGDSIFTKNGTLSLGQNMRVAYMADGGYNFEDGVTVSESAAKKLTSIHLHKESFESKEDIYHLPNKYQLHFPGKITEENKENYDENGIIKEGAPVKPGEPLIIAMRKVEVNADNDLLSRISKKLVNPWRDASLYWQGEHEGTVSKVIRDKDGNVKVYVKTYEPGGIADKIAGRFGNKGVIARILPDDKMPRDKDGNPFEVLLSPLSIPSRMNPGQIYETVLGKVAKKTGKPILWENFKSDDTLRDVKKILKENGFDEDGTEEVYDADGNKLGGALTGYHYILKLSKQAKTGFSARSAGAEETYDADETPTRGGEEGAKALDQLSLYAMLAHGATNNLREMSTDKATKNLDFWAAVRSGSPLPPPKQTFAYQKFLAYLKASGVNVERRGDYLQLLPLTDDQILEASNGEVTKAKFLNAKDLTAKKGGFLDPSIFGVDQDKWGHIRLATPVVNPVFKGGLREILGITEEEMNNIPVKELQKKLSEIDLKKQAEEIENQLKKTTSPQLETQLNRRLRYIKALQKSGIDPQKAYFLNHVPVIPPNMRPIVGAEGTDQIVAETNFLYRDLMLSNEALHRLNELPGIPDELKEEVAKEIQRGAEALAGLNGPIGKYAEERMPSGFIEQIKGIKAKEGFFQRKVLKKRLDVTGRGVITPDPSLGLDEIGLPEDMAWKIYEPFIEQRLRRSGGYTHAEAQEQIKKRSSFARDALLAEMQNRPVILNRPPSLHKFSLLAFNPTISNRKTIRIPSLIVKGFNADFDGDTMIVHVPVRNEAVQETKEKLMASHSLFNPRSGQLVHTPSGEAIIGLYRASQTEGGLKALKEIVPERFHSLIKPNMTKKEINNMFSTIAHDEPETYRELAKKFNIFGNEVAFKTAASVTLNDLDVKDEEIEKLKKETLSLYLKYKDNPKKVNEILADHASKVRDILQKKKNNFVDMVVSGAKSNIGQVNQMIGIPMQYTNHDKSPIPIPVLSNYSKGMGVNDYWISQFSARRGMVDRKMETMDPGAFAKMLLINTITGTVDDNADLDDDGEEFSADDKSIINRFLAQDVYDKKGKKIASKGDAVTPKLFGEIQKHGVEKVNIHTVLSAKSATLIHPKSYGLTHEGNLYSPGTNIGAIAGQSVAEPLQQGAMKTFHTGGAVGTDNAKQKIRGIVVDGFEKVKKLLELPESVPGQATVSTVADKVKSVDKNPAGGYIVKTVNGNELFMRPGLNPLIKPGDTIDKGQPISDGFVHPRDILETMGMEEARKHMVNEIMSAYKASGTDVDRRNVEVIVKTLTNTAKVVDPGHTDYIKGDIIDYDEAVAHNKKKPYYLPKESEEIIGKRLAEDVGGYPAGTLIDENNVDDLRSVAGNELLVRNDPIKVRPILVGIKDKPVKAADWITQLGYGYIERGITQRSPAMERAPIHGTSPIPAYVYGVEFGKQLPY